MHEFQLTPNQQLLCVHICIHKWPLMVEQRHFIVKYGRKTNKHLPLEVMPSILEWRVRVPTQKRATFDAI